MTTIPGVSNNELIRTTWGNTVATELNSNVVKKAGTSIVTGTIQVDGTLQVDGTFITNGPHSVRKSDNIPLITFFNAGGTLRFAAFQATASAGVTITSDPVGSTIRFVVAGGEVAEMLPAGHLEIPGEMRPVGGLETVGVIKGNTLRGGNTGGPQVQVVDTNGGKSAYIAIHGEAASIDTLGTRTGYVGYLGSTTMQVRNELIAGELNMQAGGNVQFYPGDTFAGAFDASGIFLVGKTTQATGSAGVEAWGQGRVLSTVDTNISNLYCNRVGDGIADNGAFALFAHAGVTKGSILWDSGTSEVHYNETSDYRLKNDLGPIVDAIERIKALRPRRITRKDAPNPIEHDAFLAHEVAEVIPNAVTGDKDAVAPPPPAGEPPELYPAAGEPIYQQLDYSKLVTVTIAALQDALAEIDDLKTRLDALEGGGA